MIKIKAAHNKRVRETCLSQFLRDWQKPRQPDFVEARTKLGMTQEELAEKCGTNKSYISRIENNSSDIRLSTLMKIIQQRLGGHLKLTLEL